MKTEVLLHSIGKISDELIAEAEAEANANRKPGWVKFVLLAACLALVFCTGVLTMPSAATRQREHSRWISTPAWHTRLTEAAASNKSDI